MIAMVLDQIAWARMVKPQDDLYDSFVTLALAIQKGYRRQELSGFPRLLDGAIALRPDPDLAVVPDLVPADPDHPNVSKVREVLRLWPAVHSQCRSLLDSISLYHHIPADSDQVIGSICGPGSRGFGSIAVTVDHHVGFAEGIVHELAHHKLRALGVDVEYATRLILNPSQATYPSPIRYDCLRPMTAVLHAQYSYTYILQLDLHILHARQSPDRDRRIVTDSLAVLLPKLEFGLGVLKQQWMPDEPGKAFLASLDVWTSEILNDSRRFLADYHVPVQPFQHPLTSTPS
jgi:hypothetical protein